MEIDLDVFVVFEDLKEGQICSFVGIFKDKIHVTHRLVIMNTENQVHVNL